VGVADGHGHVVTVGAHPQAGELIRFVAAEGAGDERRNEEEAVRRAGILRPFPAGHETLLVDDGKADGLRRDDAQDRAVRPALRPAQPLADNLRVQSKRLVHRIAISARRMRYPV